ncbi:MAG TPA: hypothetical protein DEP04_08050 [Dehalococcoidia bacterium]|nr:hypothetical protein [Dehalococcoidia bacterium]
MNRQYSIKEIALGKNPNDPYPGCDGGDLGSPESPSIWVFGLEWGYSGKDKKQDEDGIRVYDPDYTIETQLKYDCNPKLFNVLAVMHGYHIEDTVLFANKEQPFVRGAKGYFKGNLFPLGFNNLNEWEPTEEFSDKNEYRDWMIQNRLPVIRSLIEKHKPKIFIGFGSGYQNEKPFGLVAGVECWDEKVFYVNGNEKRILYSKKGLVDAVIIPHTAGPGGLNSYESRRICGEFIRETFLDYCR